MVKIALKDGSKIEVEEGTTILDVAKKISEGLARVATCGEVNGEIKIGNYFYMSAENVKITNITYDNQLLHQEFSVWMVMHLQYYWKAIKVKNHKKT